MKTVVRTQKITIEKPTMQDDAWISCILQSVNLGDTGDVMSVSGRVEQLHRIGSKIYGDIVTITNPMTGVTYSLSALDVQLAIAALSRKWIIEDYQSRGINAYFDEEGNVVIGES